MNKSNTTKLTYASMKPIMSKGGCFSDDNCFTWLLMGIKIKENGNDSVKQVHQQALALLRPQDKLERGVGILQEMG